MPYWLIGLFLILCAGVGAFFALRSPAFWLSVGSLMLTGAKAWAVKTWIAIKSRTPEQHAANRKKWDTGPGGNRENRYK